jgi:hypothetical protein
LVNGNYFGGGEGHHLRSLIHLRYVGWVPIEATSAGSFPAQFIAKPLPPAGAGVAGN